MNTTSSLFPLFASPTFLLIIGFSQIIVGIKKTRKFAKIDKFKHSDGICRLLAGIAFVLISIMLFTYAIRVKKLHFKETSAQYNQ